MKTKSSLNQKVGNNAQLKIDLDTPSSVKSNTIKNTNGKIISITRNEDIRFRNHVNNSIEQLKRF
ncbi:MAG: hypothetical protein ACOYMA_08585 [Bacteroidia bacterium]